MNESNKSANTAATFGKDTTATTTSNELVRQGHYHIGNLGQSGQTKTQSLTNNSNNAATTGETFSKATTATNPLTNELKAKTTNKATTSEE